jgi:hypothetical protein
MKFDTWVGNFDHGYETSYPGRIIHAWGKSSVEKPTIGICTYIGICLAPTFVEIP